MARCGYWMGPGERCQEEAVRAPEAGGWKGRLWRCEPHAKRAEELAERFYRKEA